MIKNFIRSAAALVIATSITGCAGFPSPTDGMGAADYSRYQVRQTQAVRHVQIQGSTATSNGIGMGVGALAGVRLVTRSAKGAARPLQPSWARLLAAR